MLLAAAFLLSQWSDVTLTRWLLRVLPVAALLLVLSMPHHERGRLRLSIPLALFGCWCTASMLWTADPANTVRRLVDLVAVLVVGWVAGQALGLPAARRVIGRTVRFVLVASVLALIAFPGWSTMPGADGAPGWHGFFPHKNGFGFFCAIAIVTLWSDMEKGWRRRSWIGLTVALLIGSQSASALAATIAGLVVMGWHAVRAERASLRRRMVTDVVAAGVIAMGTAVIVWRPDLALELLGRDSSLTGRREVWTAVARQIGERPLQGHGFGGVWDPASPVTLDIWREARFNAFYAHSGYLDLPLQVGLVGLSLFVILVLSLVRQALRRHSDADGAWPLGVLAVLLVTALTESSPFTGSGLLLFSLLSGVLLRGRPNLDAPRRSIRRRGMVRGGPSLIAATGPVPGPTADRRS
ncbi:O-antigen ligase family protein [Geodermatophilus sp. CPCC 205506]|uniref:O-antigen ligase family protein n=1 Tax=Geodermatophilus sp. CPCC 205506 TaxID=2936596 RepID=UPI003EECB3DF